MVSTLVRRSLLILLLLGAHLCLAVGFSAFYPAPSAGPNYYPGVDDLAQNYDRYLDEEVGLQGKIIKTDPATLRTRDANGQALEFTLTGPPAKELNQGDTVRITGVVEPDYTVAVTNVVRHSGRDLRYTYVISFLAGLLVLFRLVQQWHIVSDAGAFALSPKATYRSLFERFASTLQGNSDA